MREDRGTKSKIFLWLDRINGQKSKRKDDQLLTTKLQECSKHSHKDCKIRFINDTEKLRLISFEFYGQPFEKKLNDYLTEFEREKTIKHFTLSGL